MFTMLCPSFMHQVVLALMANTRVIVTLPRREGLVQVCMTPAQHLTGQRGQKARGSG
jgi:hypothetical protein